jgi:hypothetical protein
LYLLETGLQVIRLSPYRADLPARHPIRLGMCCRFSGMLFSLIVLSDSGQPSDPDMNIQVVDQTAARLRGMMGRRVTRLA